MGCHEYSRCTVNLPCEEKISYSEIVNVTVLLSLEASLTSDNQMFHLKSL